MELQASVVKSIVYEHKKTERNEKTKKQMKENEKYSDITDDYCILLDDCILLEFLA